MKKQDIKRLKEKVFTNQYHRLLNNFNIFGVSLLTGAFAAAIAYLTHNINIVNLIEFTYVIVYGFAISWFITSKSLDRTNADIMNLANE